MTYPGHPYLQSLLTLLLSGNHAISSTTHCTWAIVNIIPTRSHVMKIQARV